jgi:LuxR family transcriptional regulator, quorum-sensing system regulator CviR
MHNIKKLISKRDAITLLEIINDCFSCANTLDAHNIINKTNTLLDFNNALFGQAILNIDGSINIYDIMNFSYPEEWLNIYRGSYFHNIDPIVLENYSNYKLQYWADTYKKYRVDKKFIHMAEEFNLTNGYSCGARNHSKSEGSLLSLAGDILKHPRNDYILNSLSSHLHVAFSNVFRKQYKNATFVNHISVREKEVLNWVKFGKSTWEISKILNISERTVKYHMGNIMGKLDAVSRSHAVAIAISNGVIDFA